MAKTYLLPEDLRTDLLQFLYQQPYGAVAKGVARLEALVALPELVPNTAPVAEPPRSPVAAPSPDAVPPNSGPTLAVVTATERE